MTSQRSTMKPGPDDARSLALEKFLLPERVDMSTLADELGINRVTLYRWFGSRDRLLVDVAWSLARETLSDAERSTRGRGSDRIVRVIGKFLDSVIGNAGWRRWLEEEGEHAMRLLTRSEPGFQPRLIAAVEELLRAEAARGALEVPVDLHELAYVIVRLIESYTYLDLITGERADARRAAPILRMLLR
jgi:AcrR family transcriptional regulator